METKQKLGQLRIRLPDGKVQVITANRAERRRIIKDNKLVKSML